MTRKIIKNAKCAKCAKNVEYSVVINEESGLTLSAYNLFKTVNLNMCPHCGYVNEDLEVDNEMFSNCCYCKKSIKTREDKIALLACHHKNLINPLDKLRTKANEFALEKYSFNKYLSENYRTNDEEILKNLDVLKNRMETSANEILKLIDENEKSDLITCLQIEVLACLGNTKKAESLFSKINPAADLSEELQKCIMLGGND